MELIILHVKTIGISIMSALALFMTFSSIVGQIEKIIQQKL